MSQTIEHLIIQNLLFNESYTRRVLPFIKIEYMSSYVHKEIFSIIIAFYTDYNKPPTKHVLELTVNTVQKYNQQQMDDLLEFVATVNDGDKQDEQWLVDETEKFCKDKAIYNAILESIQIIEGKDDKKTTSALPSILSDALAVSFDTAIGHDYIKDAESRYEFYHRKEAKIPFDLEYFNRITGNGISEKTLNVVIAGTGVGKSMFLCHYAASCLTQNKNVLYITCEMAEERIAERIDANIMDIGLDDLKVLPKDLYAKRLYNATRGISGKLIIKEYPTSMANVNNFRHLMDELLLKKKFKADVVIIDYLNICASFRYKQTTVNSYTYVKSVAEELRGLAVERGVPIFTATQTNRQGFSNSDLSLEDTAESFGLPQTADFMFALISTEELEKLNQIMVKQLKNRYKDVFANRKFLVGVDRNKMKLYNLDETLQNGLTGVGFEEDIKDSIQSKFSQRRDKVSDWKMS